MLHEHGRRVRGLEGRLADEHLIPDDAQRILVAAAVEVALPHCLFGRHVGRRADRDAREGQPGVARGRARDTKVGDESATCRPIDENVVRLDVAMDDAARVRVVQRIRDLTEDAAYGIHGEPRLACESCREALALDERHDEKHDPATLIDGVDRYDVWVTELRGRLCLAQEPSADVFVECQLGRKGLHRNVSMQPQIERAIHRGHSAAADLGLDQVLVANRGDDAVVQIVSHNE